MLWIKEQEWLRAFVLWYSVLRIRWQRLARSGLIAWTDRGQTFRPVENLPFVQQFRHGKMSIERQAMGTDGLALPGQAWRCRAKEARTGAWLAEAALWIVRTGSPWRDLPEEFGKCNTVFKRFRDWVKTGIWQERFDVLSGQPDMQYAMADATIVKMRRHSPDAGLEARP